MIDTHAHLHLPDFDADRETVITRNLAIGITGILEVCISLDGWPAVARLMDADRRICVTAGIHPHEAGRAGAADLRRLEPRLQLPKVRAIGETGIDTYRDYAPIEDQRALFAAHVALARETGMPLVVHCREAFGEVFAILDREGRGKTSGVFHCFSGTQAEAREVLARGLAIGLGGAVTYAPERWKPIIRALPAASILLETDCPYLRPAPDRHGRNEPALVFRTAEVVAEMRGVDVQSLEHLADANATRLFGFAE